MGRHSSGKSNYAIAGWMWGALIAILLVVALMFGWNALNRSNSADSTAAQCPEGDYAVTVWADESRSEQAEKLTERYNAEPHVVQDKCVKAQLVPMADSAALDKLTQAGSSQNSGNGASGDVAGVWIPKDPQRAASGLKEAAVGVADGKAPIVDGATVFSLSSGSAISELTSRAGSDFTSFATDTEGAQVLSVDTLASGAAQPGGQSNDRTAAEKKPAEDTQASRDRRTTSGDAATTARQDVTFVLDTSGSMGLYEGELTRLDNLRGPLQKAMKGVGSAGGSVGLWNYSSPLSAGVTRPYRNNVDISNHDDGTTSSAIVSQLSYGGATHTYESIMVAYGSAVAGAKQSTSPTFKVVLITDGPNDGGNASLNQAIAEIRKLHGEVPVVLNVVSIGGNVDSAAMEQLAKAGGGAVYPVADSLSVTDALQRAVNG